MQKEGGITESAELLRPGYVPAVLEIVEYVKYFFSQGKSKETIKELLQKVYTYQEVDVAFDFYEKFMK